MPYRTPARDEDATRESAEIDALGATLVRRRWIQKLVARVACALLVAGIAALIALTLWDARIDYARHDNRWENTCGIGVAACSEGEACTNDDYSFALPIGRCERPCTRKYQTCSASGRECREEEFGALRCVRVLTSWR
ncbi:MAG TPA: hypothetical protein VLM85_15585 [Polyangiaceae bacterium]|nr:hypothetical protein [Polyangiaceae bacterium]